MFLLQDVGDHSLHNFLSFFVALSNFVFSFSESNCTFIFIFLLQARFFWNGRFCIKNKRNYNDRLTTNFTKFKFIFEVVK